MKKKKKCEKKEPIKLSKLNIYINIGCLIAIVLFIINNIILYFNDDYAYFFIANISNNINGLFYYLNSNINYLSIILGVLYLILLIIDIIVDIYYEEFSKRNYEERSKIVNRFYTIFIISSILFIFPNYLSQFSNHLPHFDSIYFKSTKDKAYEPKDLIRLNEYLSKTIISEANKIERNEDNTIKTNINYNKQAVKNLKNISDEIKLLKGLYPKKSSRINNAMRGVLGSKVVGFTTPYNTYFDYTSPSTSIINTITHEFCHTKGILRESEAVYCTFLAGIKSDDELSNYAAHIEAFSWASEALFEIDPETADRIEDEVLSKCLTDNYKEVCDVYTKNTEEYINGSKIIRITSYRLKNYKDKINELKESLDILKKNNAKIMVNKEEKNIDDIVKLINESSEEHVVVELDINEKVFNNIKDSIKDESLYISIYQQNKKDEKSKKRENDPVKYYLAPLKDKDEHMIINLSYSSIEHDYSRVARLLLEHYEKEGYKN